jgi:hypothetical protein
MLITTASSVMGALRWPLDRSMPIALSHDQCIARHSFGVLILRNAGLHQDSIELMPQVSLQNLPYCFVLASSELLGEYWGHLLHGSRHHFSVVFCSLSCTSCFLSFISRCMVKTRCVHACNKQCAEAPSSVSSPCAQSSVKAGFAFKQRNRHCKT